jgi:hypothetical protein
MIPFEALHLSPLDERFVNDFANILTLAAASSDRPDLYEKIVWALDVICMDFGPHLFLQQPRLLNVPSPTIAFVVDFCRCWWTGCIRMTPTNDSV